MEITLDKKTNKPLYISDRKYFYEVFPFVKGYYNSGWDFFQGSDANGTPKGSKGYTFGVDGRTSQLALTELKKAGILKNDLIDEVNDFSQHTGFSYSERKFPTRCRIYLTPPDFKLKAEHAYLIYSHYEVRWGRNLSWAKLIPVKIENN